MAENRQPPPGANGAPPEAPAPAGPEDYGVNAAPEPIAQGSDWAPNGTTGPQLGPVQPPVNYEVEQGLLGALLENNEAYDKVADTLRPEHFADAAHGRIYEAVGRLIERGQTANAVTLKNLFDHDEALSEVGGAAYLAKLESSRITIVNAADYGRHILDLWLRRELIMLGEDLAAEAGRTDYHEFATDLVDRTAQKVFDLAEGGGGKATVALAVYAKTVMEEIEEAIKRGGGMTGLSTGLRDLDELLGGFQPADLIVLGGRPGMGKSAFATTLAYHAAETGGPCLFFSLEMTAKDITRRIIAERADVPMYSIRRCTLGVPERLRLQEQAEAVVGLPLFLDDSAALNVRQIHTRARRLKRSLKKLGLIVVDHLGFMRPVEHYRSRVEELSEIMHGFRAMAKDLDVPVLVLSQLSRQVETRDDKRPMLSDLRDSGDIEQDADVVMFLYRESYYLKGREPRPGTANFVERFEKWEARKEKTRNLAEVIVAKQRNGPVDTVKLYFDENRLSFRDLAPEQ